MKRQDFHFELPDNLIAQQPAKTRLGSRLLVLGEERTAKNSDAGKLTDGCFPDLIDFIQPNDCLIFNNTKVIPARLFGLKETGGKVELLIERVLDDKQILTHMRASKSPKKGAVIRIENAFDIEVLGRDGALFVVKVLSDEPALNLIEQHGHMPLPPYIAREDVLEDKTRYQTVYSTEPGAVAAPTAGLHFDEDFLARIEAKGVKFGYVTLHVGAGTFKPVQVDDISEHRMHSEVIDVQPDTVELIRQTKANGGRVIAIGTTSVRSLESAAWKSPDGKLAAYKGETDIFITPGYAFNVVDVLLTNFHLPESTLIMLVSAFSGYDNTMQAYQHAVEKSYRFFSYGDAMLVFNQQIHTMNKELDILSNTTD